MRHKLPQREHVGVALDEGPQRSPAIVELTSEVGRNNYEKNSFDVWTYTGELEPEDMRTASGAASKASTWVSLKLWTKRWGWRAGFAVLAMLSLLRVHRPARRRSRASRETG